MAHGIVMAALVVLAQAAGPADIDKADLKKLEPAQRLLQNGRYRRGGGGVHRGRERCGEATRRSPAQARKSPSRWARPSARPARENMPRRSIALKALLAKEPKNADVAARLAELHFNRGEWEAADAAVKQALEASPDHLLGALDRGPAARLPRKARRGGPGLQMVRRPLQQPAAGPGQQRPELAAGGPGRRALLSRHGAGRGAEAIRSTT